MTTNFMITAVAFALNTNGLGVATRSGVWSGLACPMTATITWQSSTGCVYQVQRKPIGLNTVPGWEAVVPMIPVATNSGPPPRTTYTNGPFTIPGTGSNISLTFGEPSFGEYRVEYRTSFYRVVQIE